jgi:glutaredoxin
MAWITTRIALASAAVVALVATGASAQNQQVYRYVDKDGRIVYSDRGPPSDAKDVQAKRMRGNVIEDNTTPIAAQQAQERFPVTLYSFGCGEVCSQAEALLNRRGVPFSTVNVETPEGAEQLNKMTGELRAPVLQVGDRTFVKGYSEKQWNSALDDAGYPKAQPPRRTSPSRAPTTESASAAPAAETSEPRAVNAPAQYPRQ